MSENTAPTDSEVLELFVSSSVVLLVSVNWKSLLHRKWYKSYNPYHINLCNCMCKYFKFKWNYGDSIKRWLFVSNDTFSKGDKSG